MIVKPVFELLKERVRLGRREQEGMGRDCTTSHVTGLFLLGGGAVGD